MASKSPLTDAKSKKCFIEIARQVGVSDDPKAFDKAFKKVTSVKRPPRKEAAN
jgi:hypothetical protein